MMALTTFLLLTSTVLVTGQRPFFAGFRPIGYPDTPNRTTTESLVDRFGEDSTERLPIEANGDRDLVDRLSKLPIDKQPFWFINWQLYEEHRNKPQTFPQKPNVFIDPVTSNVGSSNSGSSSSQADRASANLNPGGSKPRPIVGISGADSSQANSGSSNTEFVDTGVLNMYNVNSNANSNSGSSSVISSTEVPNSNNGNKNTNNQSKRGGSGFENKKSEALGDRFNPVSSSSGTLSCGCRDSNRRRGSGSRRDNQRRRAQKKNKNGSGYSRSELLEILSSETEYSQPDSVEENTDYLSTGRIRGYGR